jgi:hypothetical protein
MPNAESNRIPTGANSIYPPILLLIVAGLFIYSTYDYGETARRLPLLIGTGTLVLIVLDFLSRFHSRVGALIRLALGAGFQDPEMKHDPRWRSEIMQVFWVAFCVISILLVGILPTVPTFIFLYMLIQGKQTFVFSLMVSVLVILIVVLVFEIFLDYDLYRGILFNREGFE